jgi:hypothetical protein
MNALNKSENTKLKKNKSENTKLKKNKVKKNKLKKDEYFYINQICDSIFTNYLSWIFIYISVIILSPNNILKGIINYIILQITYYVAHYGCHNKSKIYNNLKMYNKKICDFLINFHEMSCLLHLYHHKHYDFFIFFQVIVEFTYLPIICIINYFTMTYFKFEFFDIWLNLFGIILYSSIHNINYGIFHVNDVHSLHHENQATNYGPDLWDVIFKTKNKKNKSIENTNHYLPNIIIILCILLFLKNNVSEKIINNVLFYVNIFIYISYVLGTIYLYLFNFDLVKISEKYNW